jgi:hypothetical protein
MTTVADPLNARLRAEDAKRSYDGIDDAHHCCLGVSIVVLIKAPSVHVSWSIVPGRQLSGS